MRAASAPSQSMLEAGMIKWLISTLHRMQQHATSVPVLLHSHYERYLQLPTQAVLGTVTWKRGYASKTSACNPVESIISLVPATIMWTERTKIMRWYSLTAWSQQLRWESLSELMWLLLARDFVNESQRKSHWLRQVYLLECLSFCNGGSIYHQLCRWWSLATLPEFLAVILAHKRWATEARATVRIVVLLPGLGLHAALGEEVETNLHKLFQ